MWLLEKYAPFKKIRLDLQYEYKITFLFCSSSNNKLREVCLSDVHCCLNVATSGIT